MDSRVSLLVQNVLKQLPPMVAHWRKQNTNKITGYQNSWRRQTDTKWFYFAGSCGWLIIFRIRRYQPWISQRTLRKVRALFELPTAAPAGLPLTAPCRLPDRRPASHRLRRLPPGAPTCRTTAPPVTRWGLCQPHSSPYLPHASCCAPPVSPAVTCRKILQWVACN